MKKLLVVLTVLLVSSPAIGLVEISCTDEEGPYASIRYKVSGAGELNKLRAVALNITVSAAQIIGIDDYKEGESTAAVPGLGIFPGSIDLANPESPVWGDPVAPSGDPGAEGDIPGAAITIELGSLYVGEPNAPLAEDVLCVLEVSEACTMTITKNTVRGGIVMEDADPPDEGDNLSPSTTCAITICTLDANADLADISGYNGQWYSMLKDGKVDLLDLTCMTYSGWWKMDTCQ